MLHIYHGSMLVNDDGTRKLIEPKEKCLWATDECFWKRRQDCTNNGLRTRSMEYNGQEVGNTMVG